MSVLNDFHVSERTAEIEGKSDEELFKLYLRTITTSLAVIADEQREANRLKKVEIEQMKKRKI